MKKLSPAWRLVAAAAIAAAVLVPIVVASRDAAGPAAPREIRLVIRDMTFYEEGQQVPNPTLRVRAGEQIRIVVRNEDPGFEHDLTVKSWNVATPPLEDTGQEGSLTFRVPDRRGTATYICTPHAEMMQGTIQIE